MAVVDAVSVVGGGVSGGDSGVSSDDNTPPSSLLLVTIDSRLLLAALLLPRLLITRLLGRGCVCEVVRIFDFMRAGTYCLRNEDRLFGGDEEEDRVSVCRRTATTGPVLHG